ncbi:hypothetical protein Bra3105_12040 [Brachybacterium halotolerans subsp. kimchii]|uniref:hypothetical protein n=1 Tax=Brachybacterium halotolerans TaxID=2795215 RepID=UPI001E5492B5|nr:hypothetical protein [Brachybacterium halotolerans]UEJ81571.1 hypothetical protein Bra3105_12040 [Brachybacterium halotolerans subsp. kimchii]
MPRNKRQAPDTGDRERAQALAEYSVWLEAPGAGADPVTARGVDVTSETQLVDALLRLKSSRLASDDVGEWTGPVIEQLLTQLVPRTVIQVREASMDLVPALTRFFVFLQETGRWSRRSMRPEAAARTLADLEFAVLEAADDPSRRSFSSNLIGYGLEHGLDPRDEAALMGYIDWYDALPDDERTQLSRTGRLTDPSVPYDPATMRAQPGDHDGIAEVDRLQRGPSSDAHRGPHAAGRRQPRDSRTRGHHGEDPEEPWPVWPPAPHRVSEPTPETAPSTDQSDAEDMALRAEMAARVPFVRAAVVLLETVGSGITVTSTAGLDRAATRTVLARLGSGPEARPRDVRSMWEAPGIVGPWIALLDGGWLVREGRRVVPDAPADGGVGAAGDADSPQLRPSTAEPEEFLRFARAVIVSLLAGLGMRGPEEGGLRGLPETLSALRAACGPDGAEVTTGPDGDDVRADLEELAAVGLLRREGERFVGAPILHVALDEAERILGEAGRRRGTP